jgi:hypothetical protein
MQSEHQQLMEQIVEQTLLLQKISAQLQSLLDQQAVPRKTFAPAAAAPSLDAGDAGKAGKPLHRQAPTI